VNTLRWDVICCYALRSILEIHLFGEVPGGVVTGVLHIASITVTTETGYAELGGYLAESLEDH
jgi:hypothetical protein